MACFYCEVLIMTDKLNYSCSSEWLADVDQVLSLPHMSDKQLSPHPKSPWNCLHCSVHSAASSGGSSTGLGLKRELETLPLGPPQPSVFAHRTSSFSPGH